MAAAPLGWMSLLQAGPAAGAAASCCALVAAAADVGRAVSLWAAAAVAGFACSVAELLSLFPTKSCVRRLLAAAAAVARQRVALAPAAFIVGDSSPISARAFCFPCLLLAVAPHRGPNAAAASTTLILNPVLVCPWCLHGPLPAAAPAGYSPPVPPLLTLGFRWAEV